MSFKSLSEREECIAIKIMSLSSKMALKKLSYNLGGFVTLWLKNYKLIFIALLIFNNTIALNNSNAINRDTVFTDSMSIDTSFVNTTQKSIISKFLKLGEVEQKVIDKESNFLDFDSRLLKNKNIIRINGNSFYTFPHQPQDFYLYNVKLNNIFFTNEEQYKYLYYYKTEKEHCRYFFRPSEYISISPLTCVQFGLGDDDLHRYFINLQKERLFNYYLNFSFFTHSGKQKYQSQRNRFEDFVLQVEKEYETMSMDYNVIKHFSDIYTQDLFNYFGEQVKLSGFTHLFHLQMMDNFLQFSYLNQQFTKSRCIETNIENKLYHHQFACSFVSEIKEMTTEINARYFISKYRGLQLTENYDDWQIDMRNTFPFYRDYGEVDVYNNYFHLSRLNEKFLDTKMQLSLPVSSFWTNNIFVGLFHYQPVWNVIIKDKQSELSLLKDIGINSEMDYEHFRFAVQPFYRQWEKSYQIDSLINSIPYYQQIDFEEKGVYTEFNTDLCFLNFQHNLHLEFTFTKTDTEIFYNPEEQLKLSYQIKKDLGYNNFLAVRFRIGIFNNFLDYNGYKDRHLFFDIIPVINISRFRIYLYWQNILQEKYLHNIYGEDKFIAEFHWNFLN